MSDEIDRSGFVDPELLKPKKTFTEEKPIFAAVQLKSSGFRDPELDKPKKSYNEEQPAFATALKKSSSFKDPELEKEKRKSTVPEENKPLFSVSLKKTGFKDPELEKHQHKQATEPNKAEFNSVSLKRSTSGKDMHEGKRAEPPSPKMTRKQSAHEEHKPAFAVSLKKTEVAPADLKGEVANIEKSPVQQNKSEEAPVFNVKLKSAGKTESDAPSSVPELTPLPIDAPRRSFARSGPDFEKRETEKPAFAAVSLKKTETKPETGEEQPAEEQTSKPSFASVRLRSAKADEKSPQSSSRMSLFDVAVALKKVENAPSDLRGEPGAAPAKPAPKEEVPAFVGVKLKRMGEEARQKSQDNLRGGGLSKTRRLPSEDNLRYLEHSGDGPAPVLEIVPNAQLKKGASFTRRVGENEIPANVKMVEDEPAPSE